MMVELRNGMGEGTRGGDEEVSKGGGEGEVKRRRGEEEEKG